MKKLIFFNISMIFMLFLTSCKCDVGIASEVNETIDIGVILPKEGYKWDKTINVMKMYSENAGKKLNVKYTCGDIQRDKKSIEKMIDSGARVLIVCSNETEKTAEILNDCKKIEDNAIKVISYDKPIEGTKNIEYCVSCDGLKIGNEQGKYLVSNVYGKENSLYLYAKSSDNEENVKLFEGAWKALWERIDDGTFCIKNSEKANQLKKKSVLTHKEIVQIMNEIKFDENENDLLKDNENKYILAPDDKTARKISDFLNKNNIEGKYVLTGNEAEEASMEYIRDDKQSMTVVKDEHALSKEAINVAISLLENKEVDYDVLCYNGSIDIKEIQTQPTIISKCNISKMSSVK